ncbi:hypothetical protein [Wenzhouxiangella sp. EGI_FJ10409]|uniref:hypothetical protein n=1 Tax=Wenzhouxiangella sp. EGI_FJ10409 TaxID=3243767 RepID=UPI0035DD4D19
MIDSSYSGGASQDSLGFRAEGQEVHIGWSLLLSLRAADDQPAAGADVLIQDSNGQTIAAGQSDSQGEFRTHVIEAVVDPDQTLVLVPVSIAATYEGEQLSATLDVTEPTEHTLTFSSAANLIHADRFEQ